MIGCTQINHDGTALVNYGSALLVMLLHLMMMILCSQKKETVRMTRKWWRKWHKLPVHVVGVALTIQTSCASMKLALGISALATCATPQHG
jgi:hypothetical protein